MQKKMRLNYWLFFALPLFVGCQNGTVTLRSLNIKVDGISFDSQYLNFKTQQLSQFSVEGHCSSEISQVYYRFDSTGPWKAISASNGSVTCSSNGKFQLAFKESLANIKVSNLYSSAHSGSGPQLQLDFYGKTKSYNTKVVSITATQNSSKGQNQIVASTTSATLTSANFKIQGRVTPVNQTTSELTSSQFKVKNGSIQIRK